MTIGPASTAPVEAAPGPRLHLAYHGRYDVDPIRLLEPLPPTVEQFATAGTTGAAGRGERLPLEGLACGCATSSAAPWSMPTCWCPGDPEATWQHQRRLETWGLCPIPVVEVGQDHRLLGRYLEAGYRHIALSPPPGPRRQLANRGFAHLAALADLPTWPDGGRGTT
jgi:hypothetical protein